VKWTTPTDGVDRSRIAAEITAVAFSAAGDVVVQSREPAALLVPGRNVKIVLPGASRVDTGHALFHSNTGGDIACASCHPEGGEDSHVWNFAMLGARRTQSLRGGFSATLPLHWDGEMRDLGQIMTEVFSGRMGGPTLTPDQAAAAGRFLDAIPALPAPAPADAAAVERGRQLFSGSAGCSDCHSGARYTNNKTVDIGTGRAFQVPSLTGVGARTPLMHNGCAPTVASRFVADCGGERHGSTAALSAAALGDLAAFLETL
jgi:mono/diheme cytochrome c family protein